MDPHIFRPLDPDPDPQFLNADPWIRIRIRIIWMRIRNTGMNTKILRPINKVRCEKPSICKSLSIYRLVTMPVTNFQFYCLFQTKILCTKSERVNFVYPNIIISKYQRKIMPIFQLGENKVQKPDAHFKQFSMNQCFGSGSGSAWIRIFLGRWIRIRIRILMRIRIRIHRLRKIANKR